MDFSRPPESSLLPPRRVFTAPVDLATARRNTPSPKSGDGLVETLYNHPSVKIVSFTAGSRPVPLSPGSGITPFEVEPGSLEWSSQLERTIAVGPFRIYRAPGSVAFLSCGSALQPILPKSQCWCVDELSRKYVLQIRRPQYWRIEIPAEDVEDGRRAQVLREVFDKVLQFEKTPCPFKRSFTVDLPVRPQTPVKKRPWTPVRKPYVSLPSTPVTPLEMASRFSGTRKQSVHDRLEEEPFQLVSQKEKVSVPTLEQELLATEESVPRDPNPRTEDAGDTCSKEEQPAILSTATEPPIEEKPLHLPAIDHRTSGFQASRSITAPPQLTLVTSPPTKYAERPISEAAPDLGQGQSPSGSSDSFHSVQSWHSPITPYLPSPPSSNPPSPKAFPYPHENVTLPKRASHQRDVSDFTITPDTPGNWDGRSSAATETPVEISVSILSQGCAARKTQNCDPKSSPDDAKGTAETTATDVPSSDTVAHRPQYRHRATTSSISVSHRALSPLPPPANLFSPRKQYADAGPRRHASRLEAVRRLPIAVIHKTCEILLSPPGHLINLMLRVAARIAAGEWRGFVFGTSDSGESIPVQWDYSDGEYDGWEDEDWGVVKRTPRGSRVRVSGLDGKDRAEESHSRERRPEEADGRAASPVQQETEAELETEWSRSWGVD